ncbi:MAG TPA: DUF4124 domain-containing protein [Gammaproteobacteria bacterium]|nr:DUF4124 domain-containing protein [Gammaproteobacteria bacterium]
MRQASLFLVVCLFSLFSVIVQGAVYQWTDENGHVHFGNVPPVPQDEYTLGDLNKQPSPQKTSVPVKNEDARPALPKQPVPETTPTDVPVVTEADDPDPAQAPRRTITNEELKTLITRLRKEAGKVAAPKTADVLVSSTPVARALQETPLEEGTAAAQGASQQPGAEVSPAAKESTPASKPVRESAQEATPEPTREPTEAAESQVPSTGAKAAPSVQIPSHPAREATSQAGTDEDMDADAEKCGLFTAFVEDYRIRRKESCPGESCKMLSRQLKKYEKKKARYCHEASGQ